ncbi:MAG: HAD family hydrolase [Candidatus Bathyarchaeia archaeon]
MFAAVLFDWDGTLADTRRVVVKGFQTVLKRIGCFVSDEFIERRIGIGARNAFRDALKATGISFDERMLDNLVKEKAEIQLGLTPEVKLFDGAVELLDSIYGRAKMALATMSNRRVIDKLLFERGVRKYFDVVISVDEVSKPKPDPEVFLRCAMHLKTRPEDCAVVEDSIFGVRAAKKAGMHCIAVPTGAYSIDELRRQGPDLIVHSLKERQKILDFIFGKNR